MDAENTPPLLAKFRAMAEDVASNRDTELNSRKACSALVAFFDQGLDVNARDDTGATPLGILASLTRGSFLTMVHAVRELIDRDANPLINDTPLGSTIDHHFSSLMLTEVLSVLSSREKEGRGLKDEFGGNVLHYLARRRPDMAAEFLEEDTYAPVQEQQYFSAAMATALRDQDQATVLHALWNPSSADPVATSVANWDNAPQRWLATRLLIAQGANPMLPDATGITAAELMEQAILQCSPISEDDTWDRIRALLEHSRLENHAKPASPSPGARRF